MRLRTNAQAPQFKEKVGTRAEDRVAKRLGVELEVLGDLLDRDVLALSLAARQSVTVVRSAAMAFIEQLVQSLDARLEQLRGEINVLTRAREELIASGAGAGSPDSNGTRRRARPGRRRARGSSGGPMSVGSLHSLLVESDGGLSSAALAARANADPAQVLARLREMEAAGRVRRTGQRRGIRWHAVASEEEWIARRAAELAARSRPG